MEPDTGQWITNEIIPLVVRWIHFLAGITWIGMLYFFNLVNLNFQKALDPDTKKKVNPELLLRSLFWFRWGAMFTVLAGIFIIVWKYFYLGTGMTGPAGLMSTPGGQWISFGGLLGLIMFFNVWAIIWPAQKKILGAALGKNPAPDAKVPARATLASKTNTILSIPMLWGMAAGGGHMTRFSVVALVAVIVVGGGLGHLFISKLGPAVKPTV
jgi:uncharacterized membrane protein